MTVDEHEAVGLHGACDLGDQHRDRAPALLVLGGDGGRGAPAVDELDQRLTVCVVHRHDGDVWLARVASEVGRAPDGRADALVDALAGAYADDADGAVHLEVGNFAWHGQALGHHDLALDVASEVGSGEDVVDRLREAAGLVGDRCGHATRRGRLCHRRRLGLEGAITHGQAGLAGQADQELGLVKLVRDLPGVEPLRDAVHRIALLFGAGSAHQS